MLTLENHDFCTGRARFLAVATTPDDKQKLRLEISVQGIPQTAIVDTGATFTILETEVAEELDLLDGTGELVKMDTRLGRVSGRLERLAIQLLATDGVSLQVETTAFVSREWTAGTFLGWVGFLDRFRWAVDPSGNQGHFYFGEIVA